MTMPMMSGNVIVGSKKFNRNYQLIVQTVSGTTLTIVPPITCELDITRNTLSGANVAQFRLYNLDLKTRNLIQFNAYNTNLYNTVIFNAGYGNNLTNVFLGNVGRAWSVREGVNFITQIESYDAGYAFVNGDVELTFPKGTPIKNVILALMQKLPNVTIGKIGNFAGTLNKDNTYSGNPAQLLFEITGGAFYIDSGKAYALKNNEYDASVPYVLVNDGTGLLNTPVLEQTTVRFEMMFEPNLRIGALAIVDSQTYQQVNGKYTITAIKHFGVISPVVSGDLITTGEFYYSNELIPTT